VRSEHCIPGIDRSTQNPAVVTFEDYRHLNSGRLANDQGGAVVFVIHHLASRTERSHMPRAKHDPANHPTKQTGSVAAKTFLSLIMRPSLLMHRTSMSTIEDTHPSY
jgi:hypothetical protein